MDSAYYMKKKMTYALASFCLNRIHKAKENIGEFLQNLFDVPVIS